MRTLLFIVALSITASHGCMAQSTVPTFDDSWNAQALLHDQSSIYNGPEYTEHHSYAEGHPFLDTEEWMMGSVTYDGEVYNNVNLRMDITSDALILENHTVIPYFSGIKLLQSRVTSFSLNDRRFVKIAGQAGLNDGYYEIITDARHTLLASRVKELSEKVVDGKLESKFLLKDRFYIKRGNDYQSISKLSQLYKLFPDQKKNIREHLSGIDGKTLEDNLRVAVAILDQQDK
jgi:hypothetical protein